MFGAIIGALFCPIRYLPSVSCASAKDRSKKIKVKYIESCYVIPVKRY